MIWDDLGVMPTKNKIFKNSHLESLLNLARECKLPLPPHPKAQHAYCLAYDLCLIFKGQTALINQKFLLSP